MKLRAIHQFHYSVARHDAVTNQMLFLQSALREVGIGGEMFAVDIKDGDELPVRPLSSGGLDDADLLLIHHSQGNPALAAILATPIPKALMYHNVTPARFFAHDPLLERLSRLGLAQLAEFRGHVRTTFSASDYSATDLVAAGLPAPEKLPLFPLGATQAGLAGGDDLLFVGRLTPHKRQALLIQTHFYLTRIEARPRRLVLVGRGDPAYTDYLRLLARTLGIEASVHFAGRVASTALDAYYGHAAAFVSLSAHEGFGIPLIEAMRHDVPVLAYGAAGVRETLGRSGIVLQTQKPHRLAEILAAALSDTALLSAVRGHQAIRLDELRSEQNREVAQRRLLAALGPTAPPRHRVKAPEAGL